MQAAKPLLALAVILAGTDPIRAESVPNGDVNLAESPIATASGQAPPTSLFASSVELALAKPPVGKSRHRELAAADRPAAKYSSKLAPKPGRRADMDRAKPSGVTPQPNDPSPDRLIIIDAFVVDEGIAFDEPSKSPHDQ
jgi:hypothetical protein